MNDIDGVIKGPKSPTTEPRCHSDQVDPIVIAIFVFVSSLIIHRELLSMLIVRFVLLL